MFQGLAKWDGLAASWLLAQEAPPSNPFLGMLPAFAVIAVLFYVMLWRPQRREQSNRQAMLDALKKNDRVVTIGGIYGVVTNVRKETDEVKIKVDEKSNVELRVTFGAISRVLRDEPAAETLEKSPK
jgi:preprotein translocase subunit YajC